MIRKFIRSDENYKHCRRNGLRRAARSFVQRKTNDAPTIYLFIQLEIPPDKQRCTNNYLDSKKSQIDDEQFGFKTSKHPPGRI